MNTNLIKKAFVALIALICSASVLAQNEESKTLYIMKNSNVVFQSAVADIDSIIFYAPPMFEDTTAVKKMSLDTTALTLAVDEEYTIRATFLSENTTNKTVTWKSSDETKAIVSSAGKVTAIAEGNVIITAQMGEQTAECEVKVKDGVRINGVIWAKYNVDAPGTFAATEESAGMFYQWNRKIGWSATDPLINSNKGTTWDASLPGGTTWTENNDPSPAGWRVPTPDEFLTLLDADKVINTLTNQNDIPGVRFTDKTTGYSVFFPINKSLYVFDSDGRFAFCFFRDGNNGTLTGLGGQTGMYWSNAIYSGDITLARLFYMEVRDTFRMLMSNMEKNIGINVRSVAK